jgi:capsular exopolysaccharide synthesis family protein
MELKDYVRIVRAHWIGVMVLTLLALGGAAYYTHTQPKVYQAQAEGLVGCGPSSNTAMASLCDNLAKSRAASYVSMATSTATAQDVVNSLGLKVSPGSLVGNISVSQPLDTVAIDISARSSSPTGAQTLADAWVKALATEVTKIEGSGKSAIRLTPFTSAQLPGAPVLPRTKLNLAIGLLLGLLIGFGYALVRHQFDRRLRSSEEVEKAFGVPVIGLIPQSSHMRLDNSEALHLAVIGGVEASNAGIAEAFRKLRTNLAFMDVDKPPRIIVVTSPKQSDGKSTIAANLAAAIAIGGQPVTLIDGDLRRPTVADSLAMVDGAGLTDVLVGRVTAAEVVQSHPDVPGLHVLASGAIPPNPSELLGSQSMRTLMAELAKDTMVIIDAPPLLPVTDAAVLTRSADGAIIVITHGGTLDSELTMALNHITTVHGRTLGIIFNRMRRGASGGYHGDYYRYEYTPKTVGKRRILKASGKS